MHRRGRHTEWFVPKARLGSCSIALGLILDHWQARLPARVVHFLPTHSPACRCADDMLHMTSPQFRGHKRWLMHMLITSENPLLGRLRW